MRAVLFRVMTCAVACLTAAACGDSTSPATSLVTADTLFAELSAPQRASGAGTLAAGSATPTSLSLPKASTCTYASGSARFECPAVTAGGLTLDFYYQLFDASGTAQSSFDVSTTARLLTVFDLTGTVTYPTSIGDATATLVEHHEQNLTNLLSAMHTLNGTGSGTATLTGGLAVTMTQAVTNVVIPRHGSSNPWPQSGTITLDFASPLPGSATHAVITFDGTSLATLVITGFVSKDCTIDLSGGSAGSC